MAGVPDGGSLGELTDREILLMLYARVDDFTKRADDRADDHETRLRVLEAQNNRNIGLQAVTGGGSGAVAGTVVAVVLKFLGGV